MATGTVKGIVVDSAGQPVQGAVVIVAGGTGQFNDMAAVTNDSGEFQLPNLTLPGRYSLQIQSEGAIAQKEIQVGPQAETIRIVY